MINKYSFVDSSFSDPDVDVRHLCAMSFFAFTREVEPDQALGLYEQLKDDQRIRQALISSVCLSLGGFQDSHRRSASDDAPASSIVLSKRFQQESGGTGPTPAAPFAAP